MPGARAPTPRATAFNEFEGLDGDDKITGNGNTRIVYLNANDDVKVDLVAGTASGASVGNDTIVGGVNSVIGSNFDDELFGSNNAANTSEVFEGRAGNDTIDGRGGLDQVLYGSDTLVNAGVAVTVNPDNVTMTVTGNAMVGTDTLISIELIRGTNFADTYNATGFVGASTDTGLPATFNEFEGLGGNDQITGNGQTRIIYSSATGGVFVDLVAGTATGNSSVGTDTIIGGVTRVRGSNFNDIIVGDANNNILEGQGGTDTVSYVHAASGVTVSLGVTTAQPTGGAGTDTLSSFENLVGSAFDDTLTGSGVNNEIEGGAGNDAIDGTGGSDTASYEHAAAAVTVSLALQGASQITGGAGNDTLSNMENLRGSAFDDTLTGDGNSNVLEGAGGNDVIVGNGGVDTASYEHAASGVTVTLVSQGVQQDTLGAGKDTLSGIANLRGSDFNDTLTGQEFDNVIEGGAGNDTLNGGASNSGELSGDWASYTSAAAGVTVSLSLQGGAQNTVGAGTDTLSNFENLTGSNFNDTLSGDAGNNTLRGQGGTDTVSYANATAGVTVDLGNAAAQNTGGAGTDTLSSFENLVGSGHNDVLTGSSGSNILTGLAGDDTFVFKLGSGADTVTDFSLSDDVLDLSDYFDTEAQFLAANPLQASGPDTLVQLGGGNSVTLAGVNPNDLHSSHFFFA